MNKTVIRILLVDDESAIRRALRPPLLELGFQVVEASRGEEALQMLRAGNFDVVLLDVNMPGIGGIETLRRMRAMAPRLPILMLTVRDGEEEKVEALELGADDYVTKPFSFRELLARIRALLRRSEAQTQANETETIELGAVKVDLAGRRLLRGSEVLPVKPKAFELLAFLMRNQGQVFTRDQLLERVWGYTFAGDTRTVDVHVRQLRRKIGDTCPIVTVWGVGYKVADDASAVS